MSPEKVLPLLCCGLALGLWSPQLSAEIPKVIFDSDMSSDWDDVGDAAILHGLASMGECEIIGMMNSSTNGATMLCMDAINTFYGKPDIPIGRRPDVGGIGGYPGNVAAEFPHGPEKTPQEFPLAVDLYRKLLAASPDKSVIIVTVGYLNNLEALLKSGPDESSSLNGMDLVKKKVKVWACAGGAFPRGGEFNFGVEPKAAHYVINNWPTAVTYTPYNMGHDYMTCGRLPALPLDNPIRYVYVGTNNYPYPSWGQTSIYQAVRGSGTLWDAVTVGRNNGNPDGTNYWTETPDPTGPDDQSYLLDKARTPARDGIDALIMLAPNNGKPSKPGEPTDLRATVAGTDRIDLQWTDNAFNETGFVIERRVNGAYAEIGKVDANVTSYSATGLTSTANESFRVKAKNAAGDSRPAHVWIYSGWTETNFQKADDLPIYSYYQTHNLISKRPATPGHISVNNDSTHGRTLTIDVDTTAGSQGNLFVYFFHQDPDNWYRLNVGAATCKFEKRVAGATSQIGKEAANLAGGNVSLRPWKIVVSPSGNLKFVDEGVTLLDVTDKLSFDKGKIGLGGSARSPVWENFRFDTSTVERPPETPPLRPSGLVIVPGDSENVLTWNAMHGATSYTVKSGNPQGPLTDLATVTAPTYTHKGLRNGTRYTYVISAHNAAGEGQGSLMAYASPFPAKGGPGGSTIIGTPGGNDNTIHKVFDGDFMSFFDAPIAKGGWVGLDYGTPRVVTQIQYAPSVFHPQRMIGGVFQGANAADFSDAVTLYTVTTEPAVKGLTSQNVSNSTPFRYLRYLGPDGGYCNVAEVAFIVSDGAPAADR